MPFKATNVAMVLPARLVGGAEIGTVRLALALRERGSFLPLAFVPATDSPVERLFAAEGIRTVRYTRTGPSYLHPGPYWSSIVDLRRQFRTNSISLIHCADLHAGLQAPVAAKLAGIPSVCHIRTNYANFRTRYKLPLALVDRFVFTSHACWENFDTFWKVPSARGSIVYDWVPEHKAGRDRSEVRRMLAIPDDAFVVGMVARISPPKDHATLLQACAALRPQVPQLWLLLVGEAASEEQDRQLRGSVDEAGLTGRTTITGYRSDIADILGAMDVHALCTRRETFGLAILEAISARIPVVATRVGGIPEIINHGETGLLHESGDADGLRGALHRLATDATLRVTLVENAAISVQQRFCKHAAVEKVEALYARLLRH